MQINGYKSSNGMNIVEKPVNAIDIIRQRSESGYDNDEPFHICNISDVIQKHRNWIKRMPRITPFYAVKCNDDPFVIETLATLGACFDCASKVEIAKVMSYGVDPESIVYANTNKPVSHLKFSEQMKVNLMTIDSEVELRKIAQHYPSAKLLLRIRFDAEFAQNPLGLKFGCDPIADAPRLIEISKSLGLKMVGVSFHVGSNVMDPSIFADAIEASRKLFEFAEAVGYYFNMLDIGGGFPGKNNTSIAEHALVVNRSIELNFPSPNVKIIAEPGRYYAASAFTLATRVHSKREIQKNGELNSAMYFINDGIFGSFNDILVTKVFQPSMSIVHPLTLKSAGEKTYPSSVWGPTCCCADQLCADVPLPFLNLGDFIIFENMGAYSTVVATTFNGFPLPKVEHYIQRKDWEDLNDRRMGK